MKKSSLFFIAALIPNIVFAADLPQYKVGPFNFNKTPMSEVLTRIFEGTKISVNVSDIPEFNVSAQNLGGPLDKVVQKLTMGADLAFTYDGVNFVAFKKGMQAPAATMSYDSPVQISVAQHAHAAPVAQAPVAPAPVITSFDLQMADGDIQSALQRWAKTAGWNLVWEVPAKFPVTSGTRFTGSFEESIAAVVDALKESDTPIRAKFYDGNRVLRIIENNGDK